MRNFSRNPSSHSWGDYTPRKIPVEITEGTSAKKNPAGILEGITRETSEETLEEIHEHMPKEIL